MTTRSRNRRRGSDNHPVSVTNQSHDGPTESINSETADPSTIEIKDEMDSHNTEVVIHALDSSSDPMVKADPKSDANNGLAVGSQSSKTARHFTRSKNTHRKKDADQKYDDGTDSPDSMLNCVSVDSCAAILASLDDRSYKRGLLRDANSILEDILFPMSFPWAHHFSQHFGPAAVRNMPRDIDDMHAILRVDEEDFPQIEKNGIYRRTSDFSCHPVTNDLHCQVMDDNGTFCATIRRLYDPGVLDLTTKRVRIPYRDREAPMYRKDPENSCLFKEPPLLPENVFENSPADVNVEPCEVPLHLFEHSQAMKRRRLNVGGANRHSVMISVKVGSTSSRSSLFTDANVMSRKPLLLPALLPSEVQTGRSVSTEDATLFNRKLGSFSCSHGAALSNANGKGASRVMTGRTRLIWTEKNFTETSQRAFYRSRLTKEKLETGMHKRPREVMVAIKVNGNLLMTDNGTPPGEAIWSHTSKKASKIPINGLVATNEKAFDGSIDAATVTATELVTVKSFPFLEIDTFVDNVLNYPRLSKTKYDDWGSNFDYPLIDCLPSVDGLIHVTCTSPGVMESTCVHDILNTAATKSGYVCSVCWSRHDSNGKLPIECSECSLLVHPKCSMNAWKCFGQEWLCPVCSYFKTPPGIAELLQPITHVKEAVFSPRSGKKGRKGARKNTSTGVSRRNSKGTAIDDPLQPGSPAAPANKYLQCALCPHYGGAMSLMTIAGTGQCVWVHEVCRIWCDLNTLQKPQKVIRPEMAALQSQNVCGLCGTATPPLDDKAELFYSGLVKCAATACHVQVHPMCALLVSTLEKERLGTLHRSKFEKPLISTVGSNDFENEAFVEKYPDPSALKEIKERDKHLCRQYTLAYVTCTMPSNHNKNGGKLVSTLPVCFCGIHNPKRDRSFFGFYPGGRYADNGAMRIPPRKPVDPSLESMSKQRSLKHGP